MRAGKLRHRVFVDEATTAADSYGDPVTTWVTRGTMWAQIQPVSGREAARMGPQLLAEMDTRITLRWSPMAEQMNARWRLRFSDIIYEIVSITKVDMVNRRIELMCHSGARPG